MTDKKATPPGADEEIVPKTDEERRKESPLDRDNNAGSIAEKQRAQRDADNKQHRENNGIPEPEATADDKDNKDDKTPDSTKDDTAPPKKKAKKKAAKPAAKTDTGDDDPANEEMVDLKIDGKTESVPLAKVNEMGVAAMQKELASEKRLETASKTVKDAKDEAARIIADAQKTAGQMTTQAPSGSEKGNTTGLPTDEELAAAVHSIRYDDEEEGAEALKTLIKAVATRSEGTTMTSDQIAAAVSNQVEFQAAQEVFKENYPFIAEDKMLLEEAGRRDNVLIDAGDTRPYLERFNEIGEEMTEWRNDLAKKAGVILNISEDKKQRKENVTNINTASSKSTAGDKTNAQPTRQKPQDTIRAMQKSRGQ